MRPHTEKATTQFNNGAVLLPLQLHNKKDNTTETAPDNFAAKLRHGNAAFFVITITVFSGTAHDDLRIAPNVLDSWCRVTFAGTTDRAKKKWPRKYGRSEAGHHNRGS